MVQNIHPFSWREKIGKLQERKKILGITMDNKLNENNKVTLPNNAKVSLASVWNNNLIKE